MSRRAKGMGIREYKRRLRNAEDKWEAVKIKERRAFEEVLYWRAYVSQYERLTSTSAEKDREARP